MRDDFATANGESFEYFVPMHKWDFQSNRYLDYGIKKFVTVLETFTHHYTGDRMCKIRQDWVDEGGHPLSDETIVKEEVLLRVREKGVPRPDSYIGKLLTEKAREQDYEYLGAVADAIDICRR